MDHHKLGLDKSSFHQLLKASSSRGTLSNASPCHIEKPETHQKEDIFQPKSQAEINLNYQKILLMYGQWNAAEYLKILKELNKDDVETIPPLDIICPLPHLCKIKCSDINHTAARFNTRRVVPKKYKSIINKCDAHKVHPPKSSPVHEDSEVSLKPTYKNIFKNAKLKKKPKSTESISDILDPHPTSENLQKLPTVDEAPCNESNVVPRVSCKLVKDEHNNYLIDVRRSKSEKDPKKVSFGSSCEVFMDPIERYYINKPMQAVLENNLDQQMELMKASLKSHLSEVSRLDLLRETGYKELKAKCLNDSNSIAQFQNMFDDPRWRKKFDLAKIEDSDDANSLDVSDIESSESSSMCSGDSLGSELDYKPKSVLPSRIPCIAEVQEMSEILFDKIAAKWERVIKKNFLDPGIRPLFRHFSNAVRLRSTVPVFSHVKRLLEPYDDVYTKKYTPHRYRMMDKLKKIDAAQEAKVARSRQRRELESLQIRRGLGRKSLLSEHYVTQEPTKYRGKNSREVLNSIIRETKSRGQEGLTDWTKKALKEDYVNLKPIIQTKHPHTMRPSPPPIHHPLQKHSQGSKKTFSMRSLRNVETSLFLRVTQSPARSQDLKSSSLSRSKLISSSRSIIRTPL